MNRINSKPNAPLLTTTTLSSPRLPAVGEYFDLVVSHIVTPGIFYVQSHNTLPAYNLLSMQMLSHYENTSHTITSSFSSGALFAIEVNKTWHRAVLIRMLSSWLFCMRMVDTGRMVMTSKEMMRPLTTNFCQLPAQAIRARLDSVEARSEREGWHEEAVEWFKHVALR